VPAGPAPSSPSQPTLTRPGVRVTTAPAFPSGSCPLAWPPSRRLCTADRRAAAPLPAPGGPRLVGPARPAPGRSTAVWRWLACSGGSVPGWRGRPTLTRRPPAVLRRGRLPRRVCVRLAWPGSRRLRDGRAATALPAPGGPCLVGLAGQPTLKRRSTAVWRRRPCPGASVPRRPADAPAGDGGRPVAGRERRGGLARAEAGPNHRARPMVRGVRACRGRGWGRPRPRPGRPPPLRPP
jgi:hypothetical protein